jgi:hypothetical protein
MQRRLVDECMYWNVRSVLPEANSIGQTNGEALYDLFEEKSYDGDYQLIDTTNDRKTAWVSNMYHAIHYNGLKLLKTDEQGTDFGTAELRTFVQAQTPRGTYVYGAAEGSHDDTVIARLLAWEACINPGLTVEPVPTGIANHRG